MGKLSSESDELVWTSTPLALAPQEPSGHLRGLYLRWNLVIDEWLTGEKLYPLPRDLRAYHNTSPISNGEGNELLRMDMDATQWLPSTCHCVLTSGLGQRKTPAGGELGARAVEFTRTALPDSLCMLGQTMSRPLTTQHDPSRSSRKLAGLSTFTTSLGCSYTMSKQMYPFHINC